ncbi:AAA family ATPase [Cellulomonas sp. DKR-3]|uniref:AAA family ATPase n=1 Tax=Cellulomonas fulva TaxID=2835530 RepID=A0ABS5TV05_9CELL|nr:AAA family ATPase [Cellulomonas fulva]MBT0992971.1 AAA family ATPase [Cellulomonas fulva]
MITEVFVQEFKGFSRERLELRPLTILIGENNSGKSSFLAAIRLLAQTVQSPDPSVPILLNGPFGEYGSFRDVVHGNHRGRPFRLGVTVPQYRRDVERAANDASVTFEAEFKYRVQRREVLVREAKYMTGSKPILSVGRTKDLERNYINGVGGRTFTASGRTESLGMLRMANFLPTTSPIAPSTPTELSDAIRKHQDEIRRSYLAVRRALFAVDVLGAMRQPPQRTYLHSGSVGRRVGLAGENLGGLIALADSARRSRHNYMAGVREWLRSSGVAADVNLVWLSDRDFEIVVTHPVSGETENLADVGRGTSQVLPVLLGGYRLEPGDTFLVEEPEIHLHPRAQAALGDYFLDLYQRGVQAVVETHSEYLILRLQQHVAAGQIDPGNVIFYYVSSTSSGKQVRRIPLDENAVFDQVVPGGFFPQRREESLKLVRARGESARE